MTSPQQRPTPAPLAPRFAAMHTRPARWLARQYTRRQLPAASRVLRVCGVLWQPFWKDAPTVITRERHTGARMRLDLSDYFQRIAHYRGCYHELEILNTAAACVRPGDLVLDGGANIGLLTLFFSRLVGPKGCVVAVEPGPRALDGLRWHVGHNALDNVRIEPLGLSDEAAERTYKVPDFNNLGAGTLGPTAKRFRGQARDRLQVQTRRGDDLLDPIDPRPLFIKLDVEGFELRALRGLSQAIRARHPAILCEVNRETLALNGASPTEIAHLLAAEGYRMFALRQFGFLRGHRLEFPMISPDQLDQQRDVLFLHPDSVHWRRAASRFKDIAALPDTPHR
ncbi:MAG: FkbM family methyltransferase [Phycisphaerales bacterium]|nr:FkbM family methyltransferase [Phycisphaerales bacterium]